jgi:Outer membrane protein beta-barrel domain
MRRLVLLTVLALGTTAVQADSGLFYLGAGVTDSSLTANNSGYIAYGRPDLKNNSWKAFAGVRPLKWLAVEADYIDLGSGSTTTFSNEYTNTTHADSSAWAAYAIGFLPVPLPVVDFYGKVGVARWKLESSLIQVPNFVQTGTIITPRSYSGTDFAWGVGVQAHVKMFGVRLEYEGFDVDSNTANVASLSVFLNF